MKGMHDRGGTTCKGRTSGKTRPALSFKELLLQRRGLVYDVVPRLPVQFTTCGSHLNFLLPYNSRMSLERKERLPHGCNLHFVLDESFLKNMRLRSFKR